MSDDIETGTDYLADRFGKLVGVLQEKDVLTEEEVQYVMEGERPEE